MSDGRDCEASGDSACDREFTCDDVGNSLTAPPAVTYAYDAADQLVGQNDNGTLATFTYDANGNLCVRDKDGEVAAQASARVGAERTVGLLA